MPVGEPDPLRRAVMRRTLSLVSRSRSRDSFSSLLRLVHWVVLVWEESGHDSRSCYVTLSGTIRLDRHAHAACSWLRPFDS